PVRLERLPAVDRLDHLDAQRRFRRDAIDRRLPHLEAHQEDLVRRSCALEPMGSAEAITEPFEGRLPRLPALEDAGGAEADNRQPPIGANLPPPFLQQPMREPAVVATNDEI